MVARKIIAGQKQKNAPACLIPDSLLLRSGRRFCQQKPRPAFPGRAATTTQRLVSLKAVSSTSLKPSDLIK